MSKNHLCRMFECASCYNISIGNKTVRVEKKVNEVTFKKMTKEPLSAPESFKINNPIKTNSGKKIGIKKSKDKGSNNCCCY